MHETHKLSIPCPACGGTLYKHYRASRGRCDTSWQIICGNLVCNIDTGECCTMSDAYETLISKYYKYDEECELK